MKKKLILIMILMIFLSGCTVKYNLKIDEDGKVTEMAAPMQDSEFFEEYENSSVGRVIGFLIEPYKDVLNENNYENKIVALSNYGGADIKKEFSSAEDYAKNTILVSQFSDKLDYSIDGSIITLSTKGRLSDSEQNQDIIPIDSADITITLPFKVIENNADEVVNNKYTWHLKSGEEREIKIKYDKNKIAKDVNFGIIILVIVLIAIVVFIGYYVYNIKSKNEEINKI